MKRRQIQPGWGIVTVLTASMLLAACSSAGSTADGSKSSSSKAPNFAQFVGNPSPAQCAGRNYQLGFDMFSDSQSFALQTTEGIKKTAKLMGCVDVEVLTDGGDPARAVGNIKILIQKRKDGVMLAQVVAAAQPGIVKLLEKAKIPGLATYTPAPGIPFVEVDYERAGFQGGEALGNLAKSKWAGEAPYLLIGAFEEGGSQAILEMKAYETGAKSVLSDLPDANIVYVPTAADPPTANKNTANALARIPSGAKIMIGGVTDEVTLAMAQAVRTGGRGSDYVAIGQGASVFEAICDGTIDGSIAFFPEKYGSYMIPAMVGLIQGQKVPDRVKLPSELLNKQNLAKFYPDQSCR